MSDDQFMRGQVAVDEPQHVVRTYASDMAAITGGAPAAGAPGSSPSGPPPSVPATVPQPRVQVPNYGGASVPIHEDIIADAVAATESPRASAVESTAPAEDTGVQRASILDRLRARAFSGSAPAPSSAAPHMNLGAGMIGQTAQAPTTNAPIPQVERPYVPPPVPVAPPPMPMTPPPAPEPMRPIAQPIRSGPPLRQYTPQIPMPDVPPTPAPAPIHTFTSDFEDRIDAKQASAFSVLAAQEDQAKRMPVLAKSSARPMIFSILGIILILAGGALGFFAYQSTHKQTVTITPGVPSLIFFDDKAELTGTGSSLMAAFAQSAGEALPSGHVRVVYLTISSTTASGGTITRPGTGGDLVQSLGLRAPDILLRNIDPSSTLGVINDGTQTAPFFILRVMSYDATFSGMLAWEPTMYANLSRLYPPYPAQAAASSSIGVSPSGVSAAPQFVDDVVSSHDVRELKDSFGNVVFLYGYADESTLIIARSKAAFIALLGRLQATN